MFLRLAAVSTISLLIASAPALAECNAQPVVLDQAGSYDVTVPQGCYVVLAKAWGGGGGAGDWHDASYHQAGQNFPGGSGGGGAYARVQQAVNPGTKLSVVVGCGGRSGERLSEDPQGPSGDKILGNITWRKPITSINGASAATSDWNLSPRAGLGGDGGTASSMNYNDLTVVVAAGGGGGGAAQAYGAGGDGGPAREFGHGAGGNGSQAGGGGFASEGHAVGTGGYEGINVTGSQAGTDGTGPKGGTGARSIGLGGAGGGGGCGLYGGGGGASGGGQCQYDMDGIFRCRLGPGGGGGGAASYTLSNLGISDYAGADGRAPGGIEDPDWNKLAGTGGAGSLKPERGADGLVVIRFMEEPVHPTSADRFN